VHDAEGIVAESLQLFADTSTVPPLLVMDGYEPLTVQAISVQSLRQVR